MTTRSFYDIFVDFCKAKGPRFDPSNIWCTFCVQTGIRTRDPTEVDSYLNATCWYQDEYNKDLQVLICVILTIWYQVVSNLLVGFFLANIFPRPKYQTARGTLFGLEPEAIPETPLVHPLISQEQPPLHL